MAIGKKELYPRTLVTISKGTDITMHLLESPPAFPIEYQNKKLLFYNQRNALWTYPYEHETEIEGNLHTSGCGLFALSHGIQWMNGRSMQPQTLADFAKNHGARKNDGTDRPMLLSAMMEQGLAQEAGFFYHGEGLLNQQKTLWDHIVQKKG
ncbi:MAG: hypothetical protein GX786_05000 [Clostridiales bacterium]|nr:hypothetical protein [Clostridiales bacterium]